MTVELDDNGPIVDDGRHHCIRIKRQIGGIKLITSKRHQLAFPIDALLGQCQPYLH